jgi:preprotein translocase subunit SecF
MQFIKSDTNIDFVGKRKIAFLSSLAVIAIGIISLVVKGGPVYGIDFAGGTLVQVKFAKEIQPEGIKNALKSLDLGITSVQGFGERKEHEFLIRAAKSTEALESLASEIKQLLESTYPQNKPEVRRVEMVGPKVGKDLREKALLAMFSALLFIVVYISGRFELKWMVSIIMASCLIVILFVFAKFGMSIPILIIIALLVTLALSLYLKLKFAMGAIVALIHDVLITVGAFSLTNKEFTLPIIAALLTIIGYSLNDTIIVFDRIRENTRKYHRQAYEVIINRSINETLSRTLLTSLTTLMVVVALFALGGGIIHDFAFALIIGIVVGTYSSIYVASPILIVWQQTLKKPIGKTRKRKR